MMRRTEKYYGELAIKNIYHLIKDCLEVREYLSAEEMDLERFPDRMFVWGILFTLNYDWAEELYHQVIEKRNRFKVFNPLEGRVIKVSQEWMDQFKNDDFIPKCKYDNFPLPYF